jgi:predicted AAA+ superfamily ATPase
MFLNGFNNVNILDPNNLSNFGNHFEAFIIGELLKQKEWSDNFYNVYHFRDKDGLEVDTIIETQDGSIILIEIKSTLTHRPENFKGIRKLAKIFGSKLKAGFVISMAPDVYPAGKNMWHIPASLIWDL